MSIKRVIAVVLIFVLACAGWWILGAATSVRSNTFDHRLRSQVNALWGTNLSQQAPTFAVKVPGSDHLRWVMPSANRVSVDIEPDYRKKGLLWYPTYICTFDADYTVTNAEQVAQKVQLHFDFPDPKGTYDGFEVSLDGAPVSTVDTQDGISEIMELAPGKSSTFSVRYVTRGMNEWRYLPSSRAGRVQGLLLSVTTGFRDVDYTAGSLSPMQTEETPDGMCLTWQAEDLITRANMGIVVPEKLNPGPLTSRITFFAPVCLLFFFVMVATIDIVYRIGIHPMHYLFVAAGFFAFHLLLAYLAGLLDIHAAFVISALVSVAMVTSYLAAALGRRFPWKAATAGQVFFLVLFSYSFFLDGMTGVTVAIGSVVTLAVLMRVTARTNWNRVFASSKKPDRADRPPPPLPAPSAS